MARLLSDLTELEKLSLIPISHSRIETMLGGFGCEAKYFYTYIVKEERQKGMAATLGNIVHSTLEEVLIPNQSPNLEELLYEFELQCGKWDPEQEVGEELYSAGREMLQEFVDRHDGGFPIESKEIGFSMVVGKALVSGYIDRIDMQDNLVTITDYKTGKKEVAAKNAPKDLQLGIYALATSIMYPGKDVYAQLYYLRSGRQKGHLFTKDDLNDVESRLVSIIDMIVDKRDFHTTANERICSYCDFSNGVCPVGTARAARFKG